MILKPQLLSLIKDGHFKELFIEELAWEKYRGQSCLPAILVNDTEYNIETIAIRNGFQILLCYVDEIPTQSTAKKIDTKLRRQAMDYICIYRKKNTAHDLWVVPVRNNEKRDIVLVEYDNANADVIWQKIEGISFGLDEQTNIVDLRAKVQSAFVVNSEKITKEFYVGFKKEHKAFAEFITGIDDHVETKNNRNKQWYTSVMLNRLMFCYFIQKKGFLAFDKDYLRNKLNWVRANEGENKFFNFYRDFLRRLFHDGLNTPRHSRDFEDIFGRIPYLNGGMFDEHQLERDYADIDIPDEAFIGLFDFFDKWNWHLDTRITANGKDINPDVLGYIFEQYVNDRAQMGAYYTKEDITEYIGRNCILPFLFDETKRTANDDGGYFAPNGFVWQTLLNSDDRYIFDAVKKGYADFNTIPENIRRGIITDVMHREYAELPVNELPEGHVPLAVLRSDWNTRTPEPWGLPAEIWRETIERLQRCGEILHKIQFGEITSINDFITYNLDLRSFAHDLLAVADSRFVGRFYHALQRITILDPTCGSGAFLFAAMNILEPLYEICIDRMQEFNQRNPILFKTELGEIADKYRSNIQYFIFKSIILRNLYGVDIMVEATEIAKLRLFLKMVAVVDVDRRADNLGLDPLPDIDFNIRCGNTLVGYANEAELNRDLSDNQGNFDVMLANEEFRAQIEEEMNKVARTYSLFKDVQLRQAEDMVAFKQAKSDLRSRLAILNDKLNRRLFLGSTGFRTDNNEDFTQTEAYRDWLTSHQPFHWLAEFYDIIHGNGGFDVIIGNPPYVEYNRKNKETGKALRDIYKLNNFATINCGNLYAFVVERSCVISRNRDNIGFIVPLSLASNNNMLDLRNYICSKGISWYSHYEVRPAKLFDGAEQRLTIFFIRNAEIPSLYSTAIQRWNNEHRQYLFQKLFYAPSFNNGSIWRTSSIIETSIYEKFNRHQPVSCKLRPTGSKLHYRTAGVRYWIIFLNNGFGTESLSNKVAFFENDSISQYYMAAFNSNLFWWYYALNFDMFNLKDYMIFNFRLDYRHVNNIEPIAQYLENDLERNKVHQEINSKTRGQVATSYYQKKQSKIIVDSIDERLALIYGFTDEELDFIINYDIKYRVGDELNTSEE